MAANPVTFIAQVREELKKVTYPTRDEVIRLTIIVIVLSIVVALFLGGLDYLFARLIEFVIAL